MAWKSLLNVSRGRGGRSAKVCDEKSVRVTRHKSKNEVQAALSFVIGEEVCKELRWQIGDSVVIARDDSGMLGLTRVSSGGNKLTPSSRSGAGVAKKYAGKTLRATVRFKCERSVLDMFVARDDSRVIESPLVDGSTLIIGEPLV